VALVANASHGTASVNASTGVATYTSVAGYSGSDSFTFKATGPGGTSSSGTVTVTVVLNHAPVCTNSTTNMTGIPSGATANVTITEAAVLARCTDADGDTMTVLTPVVPKAVAINAGQSVATSFSVSDGHGGTGSGTITYSRP